MSNRLEQHNQSISTVLLWTYKLEKPKGLVDLSNQEKVLGAKKGNLRSALFPKGEGVTTDIER